MSLISAEKTGTNEYTLKISIAGEVFSAAVTKAFNKNKGKFQVPGYRKGKAPRHMIEKMYGSGVFYEDALDDVFPDVYKAAVEEAGIDVVSAPFDFDVSEIGPDGVEFSVKAEIKPVIELKEYKGLTAEKAEVEVTDADVDHELGHMREHEARIIDVDDRAAAMGDTANIDFEGFKDGVAFDGGKGESYDLELGSGSFIPGFEEAVVGHSVGEEFDIDVTFPEDYGAEELAGAPVVFHVKINSLTMKELPELDDEFAKDVSEDAETLDDLKKSIREDLEKRRQESADRSFRNAVIAKLADCVEAEIPNSMIESNIDSQLENFKYQLMNQGLSIEQYLQYTGATEEVMRESMRDSAESSVKVDLALEKIAELEGIDVTDEDVGAEYAKMAEMYGMDVEKIKEIVAPDMIKGDLLKQKTADFVVENAVVEAPAAGDDGEKADDAE